MNVELVNKTVVRVETAPDWPARYYCLCTRCGAMQEAAHRETLFWDLGSMCEVCEEEASLDGPVGARDWRQPWL